MYRRRIPNPDSLIMKAVMAENQRLHWIERTDHRALIKKHARKHRAVKKQRTPCWADRKAIRELRAEARRLTRLTGILFHTDHVIPLQGKLVSGLNIADNMQILTAVDNRRKGHSYTL